MFKGSIVAIVTPMHKDGSIDYHSLSQLVDWHLRSGTDGIVVLGTTGESPTIQPHERKQIIRNVITQVNAAIPVIVGTGTNCTHHTIELTKEAMELGADAALLVTPYYNKPTQNGLFAHFAAIAQAVPLPQILYNVPSRTGCDLLPETLARLTQFANIVALKEASGTLERLQQLCKLDLPVDLLSGDDKIAADFILQGGKGVISVVANIAPKETHALASAALNKKNEEVKTLDSKLAKLYELLFVEANPIPVKWALKEMGLIEEGIRLPLTPLAEKYHTHLQQALQGISLL